MEYIISCTRFKSSMVMDMSTDQPPQDVRRCHLVACLISGKGDQSVPSYPKQPKNWLECLGGREQKSTMGQLGGNGVSFVQRMEFAQLPLL